MQIKTTEYNKSLEIKPCPFCGKTEKLILESYDTLAGEIWRIFCAECMVQMDRGCDQEPDNVIEAWNKREMR